MLSHAFALDTLSRLKGIETGSGATAGTTARPLDTLSRLKGIETRPKGLQKSVKRALDTLSRLKGIETPNPARECQANFCIFGYAFPFEGN